MILLGMSELVVGGRLDSYHWRCAALHYALLLALRNIWEAGELVAFCVA